MDVDEDSLCAHLEAAAARQYFNCRDSDFSLRKRRDISQWRLLQPKTKAAALTTYASQFAHLFFQFFKTFSQLPNSLRACVSKP
jgi:hypothetical protein